MKNQIRPKKQNLPELARKITPFFNLFDFERKKVLQKFGFKITAFHVDFMECGWIRLHVRWTADVEEYKFKYPVHSSTGYGGKQKYFGLKFPEVRYRFRCKKNSWMESGGISIGLQSNDDFPWGPMFVQKIKYGANFFFSPKDFNSGKGDIPMFLWEKDLEEKRKLKVKK